MTEENGFFRWVYRLLALGALAGLALVAYFAIAGLVHQADWREREVVEVAQPDAAGKPAPAKLRFGDLETIAGSTTKLIEVTSGEAMSSSKYGSGGGDYAIRNLVFVDGSFSKARWLFERNDYRIHSVDKLCNCKGAPEAPVIAIYLQITRADTSHDGEVNGDDAVIPALLRPDGSGYAEVGKPVDRILDHTLSSDRKSLGLLVETGNQLLYRQIALDTFAQTSEQLVTEIRGQ